MSFSECLAFVIEQEGGYSNDLADPGGATKFGISQRAYPKIDILALTRDAAADIYRRDYWTPMHCDEMPYPIALCAFDMAVNMGLSRSAKVIQSALGIADDGIIGPQTLAAIRQAHPADLVANIHCVRDTFYRGLMNFHRYGTGWLARNDRCRDLALAWCQNA